MWAKTFRHYGGLMSWTCSRSPRWGCPRRCCWCRWARSARLRNQGIGVTVIDPRWVLPVPGAVIDLARRHKLVVTLEDHGVAGGVGSAVSAALRRAEIDVPCRDIGVPQQFLAHASRKEVLADVGLTDQDVGRQITGWVAALASAEAICAETETSEQKFE